MDKNTITGLVLCALLLIGFSFLSRPSQEQLDAQKKYYDSLEVVRQQQQEALEAKAAAAYANEKEYLEKDTTALFYPALEGKETFPTIQNDLVEVTFDNLGGRVYSAMLKKYNGQDGEPLILFNANDASMNFNFYGKKKEVIQTESYYFDILNHTDSTLTMRLAATEDSYIDFKYALKHNSYLVSFEIEATNMDHLLASTPYVDITWSQRARQLEKGFTYENRLSELTYKVVNEGTKSLSASKEESKNLEYRADWIGFKNQFFSSVFIANQDFDKIMVKTVPENQGSGYIKDYSAEMNTFFDPSGREATSMYFYFGPNHYKTLRALDKDRTDKWKLDTP